ncbi:MAG: pilus assembly protein PilP [Zoogloeaceae bacterium]|jgi:type IV pilus assembly protein PilP|nr:pilus assembly protein PilP [Zoogloeaceae bacterium]
MKGAFAVAMVCAASLAGCANDQEDIQKWMEEQSVGMHGAVKPLPEVKIFPVVDYVLTEEQEPFNAARLEPTKPEKRHLDDPRLNPDRQREPLEAFPLGSLKMVGALAQDKGAIHALIQADDALYQVRVGNFMGQHYGRIIAITEDKVELQELIEDLNEGWIERISTLQLQERQEAEK